MTRRAMWTVSGLATGTIFTAGVALGYALRPDSGAHVLARTADEWAAFGTCATFVIATAAAVIAFAQAAEARRLRIDQAQPYVVAYLDPNPNVATAVELVIRNFGTTAARNVKIDSIPTMRRTDGGGQVEDVWLPADIPSLAPQQEWRTIWDMAAERSKHSVLKNENRHVVTVSYDGVEHTPRQVSRSDIDWGAYIGRLYVDTKTMHHAARSIGDIAKALGKWSEGNRGLSVYTRDGHARDARNTATLEGRAAEQQSLKRRPRPSSDPEPPALPEAWIG